MYIYSYDPKNPLYLQKVFIRICFFFSIIWKMSVEAMNMILKLRIHTGFRRGGGTFLHWSRDVMNMCRLKTGVVFDKSLHGHVINYTLVFSNRQGASPTKQQQLTNSVGKVLLLSSSHMLFFIIIICFCLFNFFCVVFLFFSFFSLHFFLCFWTLHVFFSKIVLFFFFYMFFFQNYLCQFFFNIKLIKNLVM